MCLVPKKMKENEKKWVEREGKKKINRVTDPGGGLRGLSPHWAQKKKKKKLVVNFPKKRKRIWTLNHPTDPSRLAQSLCKS